MQSGRRGAADGLGNFLGVLGFDILIQRSGFIRGLVFGLDFDQRTERAQARAAHATDLDLAIAAGCLDLGLEVFGDGRAAERFAGRADADVHVMFVFPVIGQFAFLGAIEFFRCHEASSASFRSLATSASGTIFPAISPSMTAAGAIAHEPKQRAVKSDRCPLAVVPPAFSPSS